MGGDCELYVRIGSQMYHLNLGGQGGMGPGSVSINSDGMLCVNTAALGNAKLTINSDGYLEISNG